jgi:hypothetical protein
MTAIAASGYRSLDLDLSALGFFDKFRVFDGVRRMP